MDLALNNLQKLICHKTQPTNSYNNAVLYFHAYLPNPSATTQGHFLK